MITIIVKADKKYSCRLREPSFEELSHALTIMSNLDGKTNLAKGGKFLIESCWDSGDEKIKRDTKMLLSASIKAAYELLEVFEVDLKKNSKKED